MTEACNLSMLANSLASGGCFLKEPPDGASMSPWVEVTFNTSGVTLTVGNNSSPQNNNHAVIKDFEFGHANGFECRITIVDEQGSSFVAFMDDLLKDSRCAKPPGGITMNVNFGWVMDHCPSSVTVVKNVSPYYMSCDNVECNFSGGKFHFQVVGKDITTRMFEFSEVKNYGDDKNEMYLVDAIETMLTTGTPSVSKVSFWNYNDGDTLVPVIWQENGILGRLGTWHGRGTDKMNVALDWVSQCLTFNGKTVIPTYNSEEPGGEIIFWEDFSPGCGQTRNWDVNCLGTYIVNGAEQSDVIEFNPKIRWNFYSLDSGGGNMGFGKVMPNPIGGKQLGRPGCSTLAAPWAAGAAAGVLAAAAGIGTVAGALATFPVNPDNYNVNGKNSGEAARLAQAPSKKDSSFIMTI